MANVTYLFKNARNSSGWGGWTQLGGQYVDYVDTSGYCVVYGVGLSMDSSETLTGLSLSTNFVAPKSSSNPTTATCYLYTSDPTSSGASAPISGYVASATQSFNASNAGVYVTFSFSNLSIPATTMVYAWFTSSVQYTSYGSNQIYHYGTGNGNTYTPTASISVSSVPKYTVSASAGTGVSSVSGGGSFTSGSACTLTATVSSGYTFKGWYSGGNLVSSSNPYSFSVYSNQTLEAVATSTYTVTLTSGTGISSVSGGGTYTQGSSCSAKAVVQSGYSFSGWYNGTTLVSSSNPYSFTVNANTSLKATASAVSYSVSVTKGTGVSSVSGTGSYAYGASCTLEATVESGYVFAGWYNGSSLVSSANPYTFNVTGSTSLKATANAQTYTVDVRTSTGIKSVSGGGTYTRGSSCTLSATLEEGYAFSGWHTSNGVVYTNNPCTLTINSDYTITARANEKETYSIDTVSGSGISSITGGGTYYSGDACTMTAVVKDGYVFNGWYENDQLVTNQNPYTFTVDAGRTLEAIAVLNSGEINPPDEPYEPSDQACTPKTYRVMIYSNGAWRNVVPKIFSNGEWIRTTLKLYHDEE